MTLRLTKSTQGSQEGQIRLSTKTVLSNWDPKKEQNANKSIFTFDNTKGGTVTLGNTQERLLKAIADFATGDCEDWDDIYTLSERDLKQAKAQFDSQKRICNINIAEFRYDEQAGIANITAKNGEVLRIDLETKYEKLHNKQNKVTQTPVTNKDIADFKIFRNALGNRESEGRGGYKAVNQCGFIGRYQFGEPALIDLGYYKKDFTSKNDWKTKFFTGKNSIRSKQDFLNNRAEQDKAFNAWAKKLWIYMQHIELEDETKADIRDLLDHNGCVTVINPKKEKIKITPSGLIAAAHLKGAKAVYDYIISKGKINLCDANGTSVENYLKQLSGYNVRFATGEDF